MTSRKALDSVGRHSVYRSFLPYWSMFPMNVLRGMLARSELMHITHGYCGPPPRGVMFLPRKHSMAGLQDLASCLCRTECISTISYGLRRSQARPAPDCRQPNNLSVQMELRKTKTDKKTDKKDAVVIAGFLPANGDTLMQKVSQ